MVESHAVDSDENEFETGGTSLLIAFYVNFNPSGFDAGKDANYVSSKLIELPEAKKTLIDTLREEI